MQKKSIGFACFRCSFLSFRCCAIYISITAWNCDFPRFLPDFEPFVLVSPDFWICGLYTGILFRWFRQYLPCRRLQCRRWQCCCREWWHGGCRPPYCKNRWLWNRCRRPMKEAMRPKMKTVALTQTTSQTPERLYRASLILRPEAFRHWMW